ncbi:PepSY domain-containing protein [Tardiphaga sp.]|jgi:hypothetical protein|uniref:PepSY domain-containing protein n=1 Tax=Tardiphaga sp. TaxID=1926292 RepID=UPI0037DA2EDC
MQQMLRKALLPMLAAGALSAAVPAMAADVYVRDRAPRVGVAVPVMPAGPLTVEQAVQVAYGIGVVEVKDTHFDGDEWEIKGRDRYGKWIEVDIDARTGEVRNVDRSII